jgi:hypothetical protein
MSEKQRLILVIENTGNRSVMNPVVALDKKIMDDVFLAGGTKVRCHPHAAVIRRRGKMYNEL